MLFAKRWHHLWDLFLTLAFSDLGSRRGSTHDSAVAHDFRLGRVRGGALGSRIVLVSWDLNKSELNERYADQALRPSVSAPAGRLVCGIVVFFGASAARSV